jgi:hypothetical protein
MNRILFPVLLGVLLCGTFGCRTTAPPPSAPMEDVVGEPPIIVQVAMWPVNRVLDVLDIVRFGVGVGPGIGADLRVTGTGQLSAMFGLAAGVGWQGRWNNPILLDSRSFAAAGPVTVGATAVNPLASWPRTFWEIRAEVHAALVLGMVAVDLFEIYDFAVGILFFDPSEDDILGPHWF